MCALTATLELVQGRSFPKLAPFYDDSVTDSQHSGGMLSALIGMRSLRFGEQWQAGCKGCVPRP